MAARRFSQAIAEGDGISVLVEVPDGDAARAAAADGEVAELERLAAENVKRVVHGAPDDQSPWEVAGFLELKTVWHPIGV